jgi:DGQHR domain-containing protein
VSNQLEKHYGPYIDFGVCLVGRNLNLLVIRGYARLDKLAAVSAPDIYDEYKNPLGTQRDLDKKHAAACYEYAKDAFDEDPMTDPKSFPEIILNIRQPEVVELYEVDNPDNVIEFDSFSNDDEIENFLVGVRVLVRAIEFPHRLANPEISRVDGNHRLSGIDLKEILEDDFNVPKIPVPFSFYIGLSAEQEVHLFKDINGEHKGMDINHLTNIKYRLEGDELKNSKTGRYVWLAMQLSEDAMAFDGVVFKGGSKSGAKEAHGKVPPIKVNTLSGTLKTQITKATKTDNMFADDPDALLAILNNYWLAVREVFQLEWSDRSNYILLQSIGMTGFAILGATLMDTQVAEGNVSKQDFEDSLTAVKRDVDLSRTADKWKGVAGAGGGALVGQELIKAANNQAVMRERVRKKLGMNSADPATQLD